MFELILMTAMTFAPAPQQTAQFQTCVWPNKCGKAVETPVVAQFQPCVWPNKCVQKAEPVKVAGEPKITTCVWPNTCA